MVNITRSRPNSFSSSSSPSPRAAEVGEIDTRAPFQSVRAAVSLFGFTSSPREKPLLTKRPKPTSEGVLDKEAQYHLTQRELIKYKELVKNSEATIAVALPELEKANKVVQDLRDKLKTLNESKQTIYQATEALRIKAKKLEEAKSNEAEATTGTHDQVDTSKEEYRTAVIELDAAKQELSNMRRDYDAAMEAKLSAFKQAEEAQFAAQVNAERVSEISRQISEMQESIAQVKLDTQVALQEQSKNSAERDAEFQAAAAKEEVLRKLIALREEHDPQNARDLELKLAETEAEIQVLEKDIEQAGAAFLEYQNFSTELQAAKQEMGRVEQEKSTLQTLVDSLKDKLGSIGKDIAEAKENVEQEESSAEKVEAELQQCKMTLQGSVANKANVADASDDFVSTLEQLALEIEKAKKEAEATNRIVEELRKESRTAQEMSAQMEEALSNLLNEAEEAKSLERIAVEENKALSERADATLSSTSELSDNKVKLSEQEYESLRTRVEESGKLADMKVAAAMAKVEALIASQMEAAQKLEVSLKEMEDLTIATEEALKQAEMADAAKSIIESELERWREQEHGSLA